MNSDDDLIGYLLDELDPGEREALLRRAADDPRLAAEMRELEPLVAHLREVPDDAWQALPQLPADRPRARLPLRWPRFALTGAAAVAVVVAVLVIVLVSGGGAPRPAQVVRLAALPGTPSDASGRARIERDQRLVLTVSHLPAAGRRRFYEAWLMTSPTVLVPLASFTVGASGDATVQLRLPASAREYRYVDISLQRQGAGLAHSSRSVLRGRTAS